MVREWCGRALWRAERRLGPVQVVREWRGRARWRAGRVRVYREKRPELLWSRRLGLVLVQGPGLVRG